jgi:hypothetical protein
MRAGADQPFFGDNLTTEKKREVLRIRSDARW